MIGRNHVFLEFANMVRFGSTGNGCLLNLFSTRFTCFVRILFWNIENCKRLFQSKHISTYIGFINSGAPKTRLVTSHLLVVGRLSTVLRMQSIKISDLYARTAALRIADCCTPPEPKAKSFVSLRVCVKFFVLFLPEALLCQIVRAERFCCRD